MKVCFSQQMCAEASFNHVPGPQVFENIFQFHCQPGGRLSSRTLPEILRMAAFFQEFLLPPRLGGEDDGLQIADEMLVPDFIKSIPHLDLLDML